ncbi:glycosyltransferase family 39 protein [Mucilaginibacter koreensis]
MSLPVIRYFSDKRLLVLIALSLISYFVNLGKAPVYILDEAKNAQCAREMMQRNDWVVPTFNEYIRTDKPPLHYFAMGLAYRCWGISPYTARLFSAACGLLLIIITYLFARKHTSSATAFLSGLVLLASWHLNFEMRLAVPDPYLILILTCIWYSFFNFYTSHYNKQVYLWLMYVLLGLGVLSKGPIAFILPLVSVGVFLILQRQFSLAVFKQLKVGYGLLLVLGICLPWYLAVHLQTHGAWTQGFFVKNNYNRFLRIKEKHGGFFLLSVLYVLVGMMPVTFFIVQIARYVRQSFTKDLLLQFSSIVVLTTIAFFTLSRTQLPNYPMPCYPFVSIVAACYFKQLLQRRRSFKVSLWVILIISIVIPAIIYTLSRTEPSMMDFPRLWFAFLLMPVGSVIALILYLKADINQHRVFSISAVLFTFIATAWVLNLYAYPYLYNSNPVSKGLQMKKIQEPLVAYQIYNPAFNFYLKQPVKRIEKIEELKAYLIHHPNCQVVTRAKRLTELGNLPLQLYFKDKDVFENNSTCLLEHK